MTELFRREVLDDPQRHGLGSIALTRPLSFTLLTVAALAVAVGVAAFLTLGEYTRKARIAGYLVPDRGLIRLASPQAATVLESHVGEGRRVKRGELLFVLAVEQPTSSGDSRRTVASSLASRERSLQDAVRQQAQLEQARLAALDRQIDTMRREQAQMRAEADLQAQRLKLAEAAQQRLESLRQQNFISDAQVQAKSEELLAIRAQMQGLERQRSVHEREIERLSAQRRELPLQAKAVQGEIERDLAVLAQQAAESEAGESGRCIVLRAPQDGIVTAVLADAGQSVNPASVLASLVPADALLQAHLFAPSSAIGFVRPGQAVLLRYQAFPYQKFGHQSGTVVQVSRSPLQGGEAAGLATSGGAGASTEPLYRITVTLDRQSVAAYGQPQALTAGMQLDADVQLDTRRLIEWIFEPVLGAVGRV
jgi:membrane fusion protein